MFPGFSSKTSTLCIDKNSYQWKQITEFIKCQFVGCSSTSSGGALCGSGGWSLALKFCMFLECWSNGDTGAVEKSGGSFQMKCCCFKLCHGNGGNTERAGNAVTSSESVSNWEDVLFLMCWDNKNSFTDNVFGTYKGTLMANKVNSSKCISSRGSACGMLNSVGAGAKITYIQCENGGNNDCMESWSKSQNVRFINVINNSFSDWLFWQTGCTFTIENGCFFGNKDSTESGTSVLINCVSDNAKGATILPRVTHNMIKLFDECRSISFSLKGSKIRISISVLFIGAGLLNYEAISTK